MLSTRFVGASLKSSFDTISGPRRRGEHDGCSSVLVLAEKAAGLVAELP
jgi:hypothetical protein